MVATGNDLQQQLFAETCCIIDQQCQNGLHGTVPKSKGNTGAATDWCDILWYANVFQLGRATWNLPQGLKCILEWIIIKNIFETKFDFRRDKCQPSKIPGCVSGATKWPWLVSDWERMGKSKYAWKSWQFILAISNHTQQANTNSVGFPNRAENEISSLLKRFVCQPNAMERFLSKSFAVPTANETLFNSFLWIIDAGESKNFTEANHSYKMNDCSFFNPLYVVDWEQAFPYPGGTVIHIQ